VAAFDVAEITGAVARRNVQATTKCDGEIGVIAANAAALAEPFPGRSCGAGMLIAERNMIVREVADGPDPPPTHKRFRE
jgi:hypothetical protein